MVKRSSIYAINIRNILVADFAKRKKAIALFPLLLTDMSTYNVMKQFQSHINNMIKDTNNVYTCCSSFIPFGTDVLLTKVYLEFVLAIKLLS